MRVLMISKACHVAAYRRKLEELAALPGMELTVIVPPYWGRGKNKSLLEPGYDRGYRMIVENPILNGHFHLHFYARLPKIIRDVRPHLVHIDEEPYDYVAFHALRASLNTGAKALFFTWQNILRSYPPPFRWFEKHVFRHAHGAIAGSDGAAHVLRQKGFQGPLSVIPQFGVDTQLFQPAKQVAELDRYFTIGYAGRLVEEKGVSILIESVAGLDGEWRLVIIGDGPLRPQLQRLTQSLGIGQRVTFQGAVSSHQMPQQLSRLNAFVLPSLTRSRWKEQFGRVLVEAMACGVPVVGSDSGEIPNVIGPAGMVFPEGNAGALRERLAQLMADPEMRKDLSQRGRERVEALYTQKQVAESTYEMYLRILDGELERTSPPW